MATLKKRVNIILSDETYELMHHLSLKRHESLSKLGNELIKKALMLEEDLFFSRIADERLLKMEKRISHKEAWK